MNHAKTPFSTEICAGAIISMVQYLVPLQYILYRRKLPLVCAVATCGQSSHTVQVQLPSLQARFNKFGFTNLSFLIKQTRLLC
jgi:hypothetical protein